MILKRPTGHAKATNGRKFANCATQRRMQRQSSRSPCTRIQRRDDGAFREIVRRYLLYRATSSDLDDAYDEESTGLLMADVVDETAGEVACDVVSTDALLGFIREREHAQLRRFGAQHLTALARHTAASNASDVPFKLLFGLPVTTDYNEECIYGYTADQDFWYVD